MKIANKYLCSILFNFSLISSLSAAEDLTANIVNIDLNPGLLLEINTALPEQSVVNQEFLNPSYDPNILLQEEANVGITFIDEGAGYRNSLGYFTFEQQSFDALTFAEIDTNNSGHIGIDELQSIAGVNASMIFNNASKSGAGGSLNAGDTVSLNGAEITASGDNNYTMNGTELFAEGTNLGFFLMQNAWQNNQVQGWDNNSDPLTFYSLDFLNPENSAANTLDNPAENSRHLAMMTSSGPNSQVILGFEDLVRPGGDNDFNDALFIVQTDPISSMFVNVPSTGEVIALQAAPAQLLGGRISIAFFAMLLLMAVRIKHWLPPLRSREICGVAYGK
ncbi:MAG: DUF4114 domain-containing protein [Pseudomonadales bacterium]|nr:DUF4114 domain-containing protein [Pseudomonadales bacterium]NRA14006.1 DUF4114 domain-containing protein [Oceanospirillaceae bacterium]